jgi:hypothetical protein
MRVYPQMAQMYADEGDRTVNASPFDVNAFLFAVNAFSLRVITFRFRVNGF